MAGRKGAVPKRQGSPTVISETEIENTAPVVKKKRNDQNLPVSTILEKLNEIQQSNISLKQSVENVEKNVP